MLSLSKKSIAPVAIGFASALALGVFSASSVSADEITVKSGDTLSSLAAEHNTTVSDLASINKIENINLIFVGDVLQTEGQVAQTQTPVVAPAAPEVQAPAPEVKAPAVQAPVQQPEVQAPAPEVKAPVQQPEVQAPAPEVKAPAVQAPDTSSAKEWIANKESGGSYGATNGNYIGRYQLSASYLNGDYSEANQERVADKYVSDRYGSWQQAKSFWLSHGWY